MCESKRTILLLFYLGILLTGQIVLNAETQCVNTNLGR
jgi:hypothetical protein